MSAGAEVDFEAGSFVASTQSTAELPWDATATAAINLTNAVTANSTKVLFLVLSIDFFQQVNGEMYSLKNGAFNAAAIVGLDAPPL
jgi:hypothetical protein